MATARQEDAATSAERRGLVYAKAARRLMPFLFLCYVLNFIDRSNVSFARLQLGDELGLGDAAYGLGVSLFFVGYVLFEVPSNLLMQRIGVRRTVSRIMVLWGGISASMMFIQTPMHFYIARFLLGVAEAGFLPGIIFYLTRWFPAAWRGRMTSQLLIAIPAAGILSGLVSGSIMRHMDGVQGLAAWQWLFVLEGLPTVLVGVVAWYYLPETPAQATWLSDSEKRDIAEDLAADEVRRAAGGRHVSTGFAQALRNPNVFIAGFAYFAVMWGSSVVNFWSPTIIKSAGVSSVLHVGLLSALPYVLGGIAMLATCWNSDRLLERRWHFGIALFVAASGALMLAQVSGDPASSMLFLSLLAIGYLSATALFWTIPPTFLSGPGAAGGIALIGSIAQLGAIVAPIVLGRTQGPGGELGVGLYIVAAVMVAGALCVLVGLPRSVLRDV